LRRETDQALCAMLSHLKSNRSDRQLIGRSSPRILIENDIEDGTESFRIDASRSAVGMKVDCDLRLSRWPALLPPAGGLRRERLRNHRIP
jgi:hypothetical protein